MIRLLIKVFFCLIINFLLFQKLYLHEVVSYQQSISSIKPLYINQNYTYWSYEDGSQFCRQQSENDWKRSVKKLNKYADKKTDVIYLSNVDLVVCKDYIEKIATELHKRNLSFAINIEQEFVPGNVFNEDYTQLKLDYFANKFKEYGFVNEWVDYLVFNSGMEYLTFTERRTVQTELQKIFQKPFFGFRFKQNIGAGRDNKHNVRIDKDISDFLPQDYDGDFILTLIRIRPLKQTKIFIEDKGITIQGANGEFIE